MPQAANEWIGRTEHGNSRNIRDKVLEECAKPVRPVSQVRDELDRKPKGSRQDPAESSVYDSSRLCPRKEAGTTTSDDSRRGQHRHVQVTVIDGNCNLSCMTRAMVTGRMYHNGTVGRSSKANTEFSVRTLG